MGSESTRTDPSCEPADARVVFVDGLRALAVLSVMGYHLEPAWLPGGFIGVDVFFVISGFVVSLSLAGHGQDRLPVFLAGFYARRLARLMPVLVTVLLVTMLAYVLFVPPTWFNRAVESVALSAFWGLSNWTLDRQAINYFEPRAELNPFTHTWSLGVEEQFYVIAPLLLFAAARGPAAAPGRRGGRIVALILVAVSLVACMTIGTWVGSRAVFYGVAFRFWELGCGLLLLLFLPQVRRLAQRLDPQGSRSATAGLALVVLALLAPRTEAYPHVRSLVAVAGTVLLIGPAPALATDPIRRLLSSPIAMWIGARSYSLYLWHWPVYTLARWTVGLTVWPFNAAAVGASMLLAAWSYRAIEQPVRYAPRLLAMSPPRRIATIAMVMAAGWLLAAGLLRLQPQLGLGQVTRHAEDWYAQHDLLRRNRAAERRCEPRKAMLDIAGMPAAGTRFEPVDCPAVAARQLIVLGDSHATAYLPLLEQLSAEEGRTVTVLPTPGCSYLNLREHLDARVHARCHQVVEAALQLAVRSARPGDQVFLPALRIPRLVELGGARRKPGETGDLYEPSRAERAGIARAVAGAGVWLQPLVAAGVRIVIEAPKPVFRSHPFACVEPWNATNPECRAGLVERRADLERLREPTMAALRNLSYRFPAVEIWDPLPLLCDDAVCSAMRGGRPLFFDGDHLSPYGNLTLLPALRAALAPSMVSFPAGASGAITARLHGETEPVPAIATPRR